MTILGNRIPDFDTWKATYSGAQVEVLKPFTTQRIQVYADPQLTVPVDQPIQLLQLQQGDAVYGKWAQPVYVNQSYQLKINGTDETGISPPGITTLIGLDISEALSRTRRGTRPRRLLEIFDDVIRVESFGEMGDTPATNTASINAAIGAAAGQGGGVVLLPEGSFVFTNITLPANVILAGAGRDATVLQSQEAQDVVTLGGDSSGLANMTLDGVNLAVGSVGVAGIGITGPRFANVMVKRFDSGIQFKGVDRANWTDFDIDNCEIGALLIGDLDAGGSGNGGPVEFNAWNGGRVTNCTIAALELRFEDQILRHNNFQNVAFTNNTADAVLMTGARYTVFGDCNWSGNTRNFDIQDGADTSQVDINTVIGLNVRGGFISGGEIQLDGTCQDFLFEEMSFADVDWVLSVPTNPILLQNVTEDALVTSSGEAKLLRRIRTLDVASEVSGITTDDTPLVAYTQTLQPGQIAFAEAKVIANQRDGLGHHVNHIQHRFERPPSDLAYDALVTPFTLGATLTGATSGATATIVADAANVLSLRNIEGTFLDNEKITDNLGGDATVNGTIVDQDVVVLGTEVIDTAVVESAAGLASTWGVSGPEIQLTVTGIAAETYDWFIRVDLFLP